MKLPHFLLLVFVVFIPHFAAAAPDPAQEPVLRVERVSMTPGGPLEFTFRNTSTVSHSYVVEHSADLGVKHPWAVDATAGITALGNGAFRVVVPSPVGDIGFYRVVGTAPTGETVIMQFATTSLVAAEGETIFPIISFSAPFTGTLRYTISGTASNADYGLLSGEIHVSNSSSASIPITLAENATIDPMRVIVITLEADDGTQVGLDSRIIVAIQDTDARWEGTFFSDNAALPFTLEIIRQDGLIQGRLVGGQAEFLPEGPFPATITAHSADAFEASIHGIGLPAESTLLDLPAVLALSLSAADDAIDEHFIYGPATLVTAYPGHPHLNTTNDGRFLMQRTPPPPSDRTVELTDAP